MKIKEAVATGVLATAFSVGAMAGSGTHPVTAEKDASMPMAGEAMAMGQGGMMAGGMKGMMDPKEMKQRREMMQAHMQTMERYQASIEALLRELVALQKAG